MRRSCVVVGVSIFVSTFVVAGVCVAQNKLYGPGITAVDGLKLGHFTLDERPTGCTVVLAEGGAVGGVDVRGGAPGTRELALLDPVSTVQEVHAVVLLSLIHI